VRATWNILLFPVLWSSRGAAVQSTGRHGIIATLDPGRNRIKREAALRLRRDSQEPMAHRITTSCPAAHPYSVVNWRIVFEQRASDWRINEFVRIENLFDKNYVGSVIIGDTNRRFFEPAPRRNAIVGINAVSRF